MGRWVIFAIWLILGIVNLCSDKISKSQYGCTWLLLMLLLFDRAVFGG